MDYLQYGLSLKAISIGYFCFFDKGNLVVLFSGFQKKTQKTPKKEIEKAVQIMKEYFDYKRKRNKK